MRSKRDCIFSEHFIAHSLPPFPRLRTPGLEYLSYSTSLYITRWLIALLRDIVDAVIHVRMFV